MLLEDRREASVKHRGYKQVVVRHITAASSGLLTYLVTHCDSQAFGPGSPTHRIEFPSPSK